MGIDNLTPRELLFRGLKGHVELIAETEDLNTIRQELLDRLDRSISWEDEVGDLECEVEEIETDVGKLKAGMVVRFNGFRFELTEDVSVRAESASFVEGLTRGLPDGQSGDPLAEGLIEYSASLRMDLLFALNNAATAKQILLEDGYGGRALYRLDGCLSWSKSLIGVHHPMEDVTSYTSGFVGLQSNGVAGRRRQIQTPSVFRSIRRCLLRLLFSPARNQW